MDTTVCPGCDVIATLTFSMVTLSGGPTRRGQGRREGEERREVRERGREEREEGKRGRGERARIDGRERCTKTWH